MRPGGFLAAPVCAGGALATLVLDVAQSYIYISACACVDFVWPHCLRALSVDDISTVLCRGSATCKGLMNRRRDGERSERNSKMVARGMKRPHALVAYDNKDDNYLQRHNELSRSGSQDSGCDSH